MYFCKFKPCRAKFLHRSSLSRHKQNCLHNLRKRTKMMSQSDQFLAALERYQATDSSSSMVPISPPLADTSTVSSEEDKLVMALKELKLEIQTTRKELTEEIRATSKVQQQYTSAVASMMLAEISSLMKKNAKVPQQFIEDLAKLNAQAQQIFSEK